MAGRKSDRDPFERIWERIASVVGTLRALSQPDSSRIRPILEDAAQEFSTDQLRIPPQRLTGVALDKTNARACAASCANNLDRLVTEKPDIDALPPPQRNLVEKRLSVISSMLRSFECKAPVPFDAAERLRLARSTFQLNFR
jgi:hypothetical protein